MDLIKSPCCGAKIMSVKDYATLEGQLGLEKLRFCDKCKFILQGEGKGDFYEPKTK